MLQKIRLNGLSVRETEAQVQSLSSQKTSNPRHKKNATVKQMEIRLSEQLQTKVNISQQKSGAGKITLVFSDEKMLEKLSKRLGLK